MLIDGEWTDRGYRTEENEGRFVRDPTTFRDWIRADGSSDHPPEAGRYRLYVSYACPWAHRTLIARSLAGLEDAIELSVVDPHMGERGWVFSDRDGAIPDPDGADTLHQVYTRADPGYTGRVTVPVLWDTETETIVNNESADILRMLGSELDAIADNPELDLYPEGLRDEIDEVNERVYENVNDGVYRCGFATRQEAYERAAERLFETLDWLEERLSEQRYLVGARRTEADWRLFTTLVRFDPVYHYHFKCNLRRIEDYPNLSSYLRDLYQTPGIAETVRFDHIREHYYTSHPELNPHRIVPVGPEIDLDRPHDRTRFADAVLVETGVESFPASDPPGWAAGR